MADTRIDAAIDAILAKLRAHASLQSPVMVYDGPELDAEFAQDSVFVGYDGDPDGEFVAASWSQEWAGLGNRAKDEQFAVPCAAVSWSGDDDGKTRRDRAVVLFSAVNNALRADPGCGLPNPTTFSVQAGQFHQERGPYGMQARFVFTVHVQTRI